MTDVMTRQLKQAWITRFDCLAGALPGKVEPSDIDQVLERHGQFLFIEFKRPYQKMTLGQTILLDSLSMIPDIRLLLVVGHPPDAIHSYGWWGREQEPHNLEDLRSLVRRWWDWAGQQKRDRR